MNVQSLSAIIRLRKIEIAGYETKKDNQKIKRLAELLLKTEGQPSRPPIVRKPDLDKEVYEVISGEEIIIAAKLAGLAKLVVLISQEKTEALTEMEALLNRSDAKEAKPEPQAKAEPKATEPQAKPKPTKAMVKTVTLSDDFLGSKKWAEKIAKEKRENYRELQQKLKVLKKEGKTTIRLNSKKEVLLAEWNRLNKK